MPPIRKHTSSYLKKTCHAKPIPRGRQHSAGKNSPSAKLQMQQGQNPRPVAMRFHSIGQPIQLRAQRVGALRDRRNASGGNAHSPQQFVPEDIIIKDTV